MSTYAQLLIKINDLTNNTFTEAWLANQQPLNETSATMLKKVSELSHLFSHSKENQTFYQVEHVHALIAKINFLFVILKKFQSNEDEFRKQCQLLIDALFHTHCRQLIAADQTQNHVIELKPELEQIHAHQNSISDEVNRNTAYLEKISRLKNATLNYKQQLEAELNRYTFSSVVAKPADIYERKLLQYRLELTNQLLSDLQDKPSMQLLHFKATLDSNKQLLTLRSDSKTVTFLRIIGAILTVGLLAPFLWKPTTGARFFKNANDTFLGNYAKIKPLTISSKDELTPSVMDERIPIVKQHR